MIQLPKSYYGGQIKEGSRGNRVLIIDHVEDGLSHYSTRITRINWPSSFNITDGEPSAYKIDRVYIGVSDDVAGKVAVDLAKEPHAFDWHLEALDNQLLSSTTLPQMQFKPIYGSAIKEEAGGDLTLVVNALPEEKKYGAFLSNVFDEDSIDLTGVAASRWPIQRVYVGVNHDSAEAVIRKVGDLTKMDELASREWDRMLLDQKFLE